MLFVDPRKVQQELVGNFYVPVGHCESWYDGYFDLLWISPADYLRVVDPHFTPRHTEEYEDSRRAAAVAEVPHFPLCIWDDWQDVSWYYVRKHEGRHRARMARKLNIPVIPVASYKKEYSRTAHSRNSRAKARHDEMWASYAATGWPFPPGEEPVYDLSVDSNIRARPDFLGVGCDLGKELDLDPLRDDDFVRRLIWALADRGDWDAKETLEDWRWSSYSERQRIVEDYNIVLLRDEPYKHGVLANCKYYQTSVFTRSGFPFTLDGYSIMDSHRSLSYKPDCVFQNEAVQSPRFEDYVEEERKRNRHQQELAW